MFKIKPKTVGSINDGGRKLKIGAYPYKITGIALAPVKSDPRGKEQQIVIDVVNGGDYSCKVYLSIMADNDVTREIAEKTLATFWTAAGLSADKDITVQTMKALIGKTVVIEAKETPGKGDNKGKTYVNIATIEPFDEEEEEEDEEGEEEAEEEDSDDDDGEEGGEEEEEEEEEAEEEEDDTPPPAKTGKAAKPASKGTSKPASKGGRPW